MTMATLWQDFHWLRPHWFWALLPLALLLWYLWRQQRKGGEWHAVIAPQLLPHLLVNERTARLQDGRWLLLGLGWLIAVLALAGPTWEQLPQPVTQRDHAVVVVLDLSHSMYAEDVPPSRLIRARHKVLSLLEQQPEALVGLVVYAGDAHVVAPLTDDHNTIAHLLPALSPDIMPIPGSDAAAGLALATELIQRHGLQQGQLLLMTDGVDAATAARIARQLPPGLRLSVLGIGTSAGAPIALPGGYLKDQQGKIVVARLQRAPLRELAHSGGGRYRDIQLEDDDLTALLDTEAPWHTGRRAPVDSRSHDLWLDRAPWLAAGLLPLAALAFRRGWLLALLPLLCLPGHPAQALEWRDLWQRPDQQGATLWQQGEHEAAAEHFHDPAWRGSALYRAGEYSAAAAAFATQDTAQAHYNRGNALAHAGELEQAVAAYNEALARDPEFHQAADNKALVEELLAQSPPPSPPSPGEASSDPSNDHGPQQPAEDTSSSPSEDTSSDRTGRDPATSGGDGDPTAGDPTMSSTSEPHPEDTPTSSAHDLAAAADDSDTEEEGQDSGQDHEAPAARTEGPESEGEAVHEIGDPTGSDPATERWLRQVPDEPAALLRRKFEYESRRRAAQGQRPTMEAPQW